MSLRVKKCRVREVNCKLLIANCKLQNERTATPARSTYLSPEFLPIGNWQLAISNYQFLDFPCSRPRRHKAASPPTNANVLTGRSVEGDLP
jgi:hypothetical protein